MTIPSGSEEAALPTDGLEVAPVRVERDVGRPRPAPPPPLVFQPGFHQALRWSYTASSLTTFRLRVPVGRAGERVRLAFRAGDGSLTLKRVFIARMGPDGTLLSAPVPVTFGGKPGLTATTRQRVVSDALPFPVGFREELSVAFEVQGKLSASAINALPGSGMRLGAYAHLPGALGGTVWERAVGLATVEVEGPPSRAFVAIGDSITEGWYSDHNDTRVAWPSLTQAQLGLPIVNAGVSGQGFYDAIRLLDGEVLALEGITDCLILLGTNDLAGVTVEKLQERMTTLLQRLQPFCRTWVSTLLPKEKSNHGDYEAVKASRLQFNTWLRTRHADNLIDLEAVTRQPNNVHLFIDGLEVDGIHPSVEGHRVMAREVLRVLRAKGVQPGVLAEGTEQP
jgi:lysophospholipase L1-like esterase